MVSRAEDPDVANKDFSNFNTGPAWTQDNSSLRRGARGERTAATAERTPTEASL